MLLEFVCSNFRSIREPVTLNLRANTDDSFENYLNKFEGERVNPACAIYGSNGTGKTNLLAAMALIQDIVTKNHILQTDEQLPNNQHRLGFYEPTTLGMEFVWNNIRYIYNFTYQYNKILKENLSYAPNGRMGIIFNREEDKVKVSEKFSRLETLCKEKLVQNRLILNLAYNNLNYEELNNAFLFFKEGLVVLMNYNYDWQDRIIEKIEKDNELKDLFLKYLRDSGSDIKDIKIWSEVRIPVPPKDSPDMQEFVRNMLLNRPAPVKRILTVYNDFALDISEESMGIQKLLQLMYTLMDVLQNGKTFVCDEIESHLHPLFVREIITRFIKERTTNSQIICASHNIEMLDLNLFRRDQIWFTDIDSEFHQTTLKPLSSFQCRKDENVQKKYLEGKYCKVARNVWYE